MDRPSPHDEIEQLKAQVATLEELLQLYEQSALEQEQRLQRALHTSQERAQQLEHAQETLQTLQAILDSIGDAVVVVDMAGKPLFSNPSAHQMLQGESSTPETEILIPETDRSVSNPPPQPPFEQWVRSRQVYEADGVTPYPKARHPLARAIENEAVDTNEMLVVDPATNRRQWLSVNARPLKSAEQITGGVAVFRDITQWKQAEQALKQSNEEFQKQAQLLEHTLQKLRRTQAQLIHGEKMLGLGQIVAGIAHEINNPVNFIHGNLPLTHEAIHDLLGLIRLFQTTYPHPPAHVVSAMEAIDLDFLADDVPNMLMSMHVGTERIRKIVQSLQVFSRLDEAAIKAVDIHQGIDSALMVLQSRLSAQPTRPAIQVQKRYGELPWIECHASQLNQVFVNILANSIDALSCGVDAPEITIRTKALGDAIAIHISDNGKGIPETIRPQIFNPFFTTKPVGRGTGLGLAICHQIIAETHHGSIECHSNPETGTTFVIQLPIGDRAINASK